MWGEMVLLLLHATKAAVASPCQQGATFPEAVVAVGSGGMVRVPGASSLQRCVASCCDLPGYDLAWLFEGRCYILSCQQGADCRPQVRPGADSVLAFLQRASLHALLQTLAGAGPYGGPPGSDREPEPLRGLSHSDEAHPGSSSHGVVDVGSQEVDQNKDAFNQSQEAGGEGMLGRGNGTRTRTGSDGARGHKDGRTAEQTAETQRVPPTPATGSAPADHMTSPNDISIAASPEPSGSGPCGFADPTLAASLGDPVDIGGAGPSEPTRFPEVGDKRPSDPVQFFWTSSATTDPVTQDVTPDLSTPVTGAATAEPERRNRAPVATVGPDQTLVLPVSGLLLDGSGSTDDRGVSSYSWEVVSGPPGLRLRDADRAVAVATGIRGGRYAFRLTVSDQQGATDSALLSVLVQEATRLPPVAHASGSHVLTLPNDSLVLNGSVTDGDQTEVRYRWTRDSQSPAAGEVLFGSDSGPVLYLSRLVEGTYLFRLTVTDALGRSSSATATVEVRPEPGGGQQVELEMLVSVSQVSVAQREAVVRQLAALIHILDGDIRVTALQERTQLSTVLRFSVRGPSGPVSASSLAALLRKQLLRDKSDFLLFKVLRVEAVACELSCSGRGQCDPISRQCSCEPLSTQNLVRFYLGDGESNCEWRVLHVILSSFLMAISVLALSWTFVFCRRGRSQGRRKTRYAVLDDMEERERLELRPRVGLKHRSTDYNSSLMMSESELDSDQDASFSRPVRSRNRIGSEAGRHGNAFGPSGFS